MTTQPQPSKASKRCLPPKAIYNDTSDGPEEDSADNDGSSTDSGAYVKEDYSDDDGKLEPGEIKRPKCPGPYGNSNSPWFRPSKSPYLYPAHGPKSGEAQTPILRKFMSEAPFLNRIKNSLCTMLSEINPLYGDTMTLLTFQDFVLQNSTELENIQGCMHPYGATGKTAGCKKRVDNDNSRDF